ncbi:MAG TPA: hypothetical protein VHQ65_03850 [Thermoanaerobaculia bacterium]|nr:hypothetical protein [Thermoanaerobaculia bacterium]
MGHIDLQLAVQVLEGKLPPRVLLQVVSEHLKELCPECGTTLEALQRGGGELAAHRLQAQPGGTGAPGYTGAFRRVGRETRERAERLEQERRRARRDLRALLRVPREDRERRIVNARTRFRSRLLAELMLEESRRLVRRDPDDARNLAELVPVVLLWTPRAVEQPWAEALRMRAVAYRGNALRVAGELRQADAAFREVRHRLARTLSNDVELHAEVSSLEASLRLDQRRFAETEELLDRAVLLYRQLGDGPGVARSLVQRAAVQIHCDNVAGAVDSLRASLATIDPAKDAFLHLCAVANLGVCLCDSGRHAEAAELMEAHRAWHDRDRDPLTRLRLRWLDGRIAHGLGRAAEAERLLLTVRNGYVRHGLPYDAATVSLDLALLYLEDGRTEELKRLARLMQPIFESREVHREAAAALMLFQRAALTERLGTETVTSVRSYLERARRDPGRRYQPPA